MKTPRIDLFIDGAWTDVSSYVLHGDGVTASRGRRSESGSMEPQTAALTFLNPAPTYPFTPDHPLSVNYGKLGRNTPIRIARDAAAVDDTESTYLYLPGVQGAYALMADTSGVSITGDIEIQIDVALDDWGDTQDLAGKYRIDVADRSWAVWIENNIISYIWSADGAATTTASATVAVTPNPGGRLAIKVTHDVNNGAAGNDVKFWTAATIAGPWTQLGATVTTAGTTSLFDADAELAVGDISGAIRSPMAGKVYAFTLLSGIGGTAKASPDFTAQDDITKTFTDTQSNTWFISGAAQMVTTTPGPWRYHGEVSQWPVESDTTGNLVTVAIEAAGQWRRLSQNEQPLNSPMFRAHTNPSLTRVKAYWSLEDGSEATLAASNYLGTGYPMIVHGNKAFADYSEWTASGPMPTLNTTIFTGKVSPYASTGESGVYFFFITPTAGAPAAEMSLFQVVTAGTARRFDIRLLVNGNLRVNAYDDNGDPIDDGAGNLDAELGMDVFPRGFMIMNFQLLQSGTSVKWWIAVNDFTNTDLAAGGITASSFTGTITSKTFVGIRTIIINDRQVNMPETHISHIVVSDQFKLTLTDVGDAVNAFNGENPATRILRLCGEEDIPCDIASQDVFGNSVSMGDQLTKTLTQILTETEGTDLGILHESRDRLALRYRTRLSMANQDPAVTLSGTAHELGDTLHPTNDDQLTVNEQYVIREKGIKAYKAKTSGKIKNTSPKAGGVGRYTAEKTVNVTYDQQVADQAGFRLFLGTRDKPRHPQITVNLHHPAIAGTALEDALLALDIGDRIVVTDLPAHLPPDDISVIVNGYTERFDEFLHTITFNCLPAEPWEWAVAGDADKRADTDGSATVAGFAAGTGTSMTVFTPAGPLWTTKTASWPFDIRTSGVQLSVTAVASSVLDAFGRTTSNGWGTGDSGQVYTATGGVAGNYAVGSGVGTHTHTTTNVKRSTTFPGYAGFDMYVSVAFSALATGSSLAGGLAARFTDTSNMYYLRVEVTTTNAVILGLFKFVAGVSTSLGSLTTGLTHVAGTFYRIRFQGNGTALRARVWDVANVPEPGAWHINATDSAISAAASMGCVSEAFTGNTNVSPAVRFDNLEVINPQVLTLTPRAVNGRTLTTVITDTFTRSASSSWGPPDAGGAWSTSGGLSSAYSVTGSKGRVGVSGIATRHFTYSADSFTDLDFYAAITVPATATGGSISAGLIARRTDDNNLYLLQLLHDTAGTIDVEIDKRVAGTFTTLASQLNYLTYAGGTATHTRFRVVGSVLQCKVWAGALTDEPDAWLLTVTDTAFGSGPVGTHSNLLASNSNTQPVNCDYDDVTVQAITGGVAKTIPAGSDVTVANPAYVGMW